MGVILSAFLLLKKAFWGDLDGFEGSDGEIVRSDDENGSWVAKMPFRGVRWGLGASHTSAPITLTWSGRRLRVFFIVSRGAAAIIFMCRVLKNYNFFVGNYNYNFLVVVL